MKELLQKVERDPESHKGDNGRVGIIGGGSDYTGAPALSAKAALRSGCDLVEIFTSESVSSTVASYSENFIVRDYRSDYFNMDSLDQALELDKKADVMIIGPGLGKPEPKAVREFLQECESPVVVDADALEYVPRTSVKDAVLTPHKGEFELIEDIIDVLLDNDNVILRKGKVDTVYSKSEEIQIETGNSAMTVGGTGDVLTGLIASLISQGLSKEEAAQLGAWLNGKVGEEAAEKYGNGALATDIVEEISKFMV